MREGLEIVTEHYYIDRNKMLAAGSYGQQYEGYSLIENCPIHIKFIKHQILKQIPDYEHHLTKVIVQLAHNEHPNIRKYYGQFKNESGLYIFMELCEGGTLKQFTSKNISQLRVIFLFKQLLEVMVFIHSKNKILRNLNPQTILLDEYQGLKIADFDMVEEVGEKSERGACTPIYAAPQVLYMNAYNQKCDVWNAGLILFEMLTGQSFFAKIKTKMQLFRELQTFKSANKVIGYSKNLHPMWEEITLAMLTFDKDKRPSFEAVLVSFEKQMVVMERDLACTYGCDSISIDDRPLNGDSINFFKSIPTKQKLTNNLLGKIRKQTSIGLMHDLNDFLVFFSRRNNIYLQLLQEFKSNSDFRMKNVVKYMLMFLGVVIYLQNLKRLHEQFRMRKIEVLDKQISLDDFNPEELAIVSKLLVDFQEKHVKKVQIYKDILDSQIIPKILDQYMQNELEKKIIESFGSVLRLVKAARMGNYMMIEEYTLNYKTIMMKYAHWNELQLLQLSDSNMKTYVLIQAIGNIDQVYPITNYKDIGYVLKRKEQIKNMSRQELISLVSFKDT